MLPVNSAHCLYSAGKRPPAEVKLSKKTVREGKRLKAWASAESSNGPSPASGTSVATPPPIEVTALPASAVQFDPSVLAQVAAIKGRADLQSPVGVMGPL